MHTGKNKEKQRKKWYLSHISAILKKVKREGLETISKKKKQDFARNYIGAIAVFILAVAVGMVIFFVAAQKTIDSSSKERMRNNVARQSEHLRTILNIHYSYMEGIAEKMGEDGELLSVENMQMLTTFRESTAMDRMALIQPDGNAYYDNGMEKNVSHRRYFKEGISGKRTLSDPIESSVDQETRVVLGVPIFHEDSVIGILGGSYNVSKLSRMLFDDLFSGRGYCLIVTSDGEIIAHDGDPTDHKLSYGDNIFSFYQSKKIGQGHSMDEIGQDFKNGVEGLITLSGYADGSDRYLAYAPLGLNDWMICYVAPVTVAQQSYAFVEQYELIFIGCFGIFVCMMVLYIIRKNRQKTDAILRSAQTDELTQVYNRKYAERFAETALKEAEDGKRHAFFIMDVDKFKEVNDRYGHAVGDVVLHAFGGLLGKQFREDDIVGRIGGDEFIILMRNVSTSEAVKAKAEQLLAETRKLAFAEMEGKGITISVGIALSPAHGKTYMDLYRSADEALYETKRNGRNGFTICGED